MTAISRALSSHRLLPVVPLLIALGGCERLPDGSGADEATWIELSADVSIEGQRLAAGKYSIWAIPRPDLWTVIFSRAHDVFHIAYPEGEEALRLEVAPRAGPHTESLSFQFPVATTDSARLELRWGEVVVPLTLRPAGRRP